MTITDILDRIVADSPEDKKPVLTPGCEVDHLIALDGHTRLPVSAQLREFYRYAASWHHQRVQLEWVAPQEMAEVTARRPVAETIVDDIDYEELIDVTDIRRDNSVLFALDYVPSPFVRSYFVFNGGAEPIVMEAGSGVELYDTLADYLEWWHSIIKIRRT